MGRCRFLQTYEKTKQIRNDVFLWKLQNKTQNGEANVIIDKETLFLMNYRFLMNI